MSPVFWTVGADLHTHRMLGQEPHLVSTLCRSKLLSLLLACHNAIRLTEHHVFHPDSTDGSGQASHSSLLNRLLSDLHFRTLLCPCLSLHTRRVRPAEYGTIAQSSRVFPFQIFNYSNNTHDTVVCMIIFLLENSGGDFVEPYN